MKPKICPHAHCRDEGWAYKATIASTLKWADATGIGIICDMPNVPDPVITMRRVMERLALVPKGWERRYRLYVGVTSDPDQLAEAVHCWNTIGEVVGLKMFAGRSVDDLSVIGEALQRLVYQTLAKLGYKGVLAVHCEMESLLRPAIWDPADPITHCVARPREAEIASVRDQIRFAQDAEFQGILHVCHVSVPDSIIAIEEGRQTGLQISCGVTPHHLLWDWSRMLESDGLLVKINPPLRSYDDMMALRGMVRDGRVPWVESDHAPHSDAEKFGEPYMSGYPSFDIYPECVDGLLPSLGMSPALIQAMTDGNIRAAFADKL